MKTQYSNINIIILAPIFMSLLVVACGGGGSDNSTTAPIAPIVNPPVTPVPITYGAIKSTLNLSAIDSATPTNINTNVFQGSSAMCTILVTGYNFCTNQPTTAFGVLKPSLGGKCIYPNLGPTQMPRGFRIVFHAADGRNADLDSLSISASSFTVGQTVNSGSLILGQPDGRVWLSNTHFQYKVTSISHSQVVIGFTNLHLFNSLDVAALNGSATIDCDPSLDSVN